MSDHLVASPLRYYHYNVDGFNDCGWGCGYRTVQTILSWLSNDQLPPSIPEMQTVMQVTTAHGWIGVQEAIQVLDILHGVTVEVIPLAHGSEVARHLPRLADHFDKGGGPIMVGGGGDVYSKTVVGVRDIHDPMCATLLILDPHYEGSSSLAGDIATLKREGWVAWKPLSILSDRSFYNLALPRPPVGRADADSSHSEAVGVAACEPPGGWDFEIVGSGHEGV